MKVSTDRPTYLGDEVLQQTLQSCNRVETLGLQASLLAGDNIVYLNFEFKPQVYISDKKLLTHKIAKL